VGFKQLLPKNLWQYKCVLFWWEMLDFGYAIFCAYVG
jgi:hypothetical protein